MTINRTLSVIAGATMVGCFGGAGIAFLQASPYRATTTLVVQVHGAPAAIPTVAALATGDAVIGNVANATHVTAGTVRGHLQVSLVPGTALVRLAYDNASRVRAEQLVQEEATVLEAIVTARLGGAVRASVVDPARAKRLAHPVGRYALAGASIGLLLGAAGAAVAGMRLRPTLSGRPALSAGGEALVPPPVPSDPSPPFDTPPTPLALSPARSRVAELRELVGRHGAEYSPDQLAEWHGYLEAFAHQEVDGKLPLNLEALARDVFEPLLERT